MSENDEIRKSCIEGETLVAYLRGELDASESRHVGTHLDACEACRAEARAFEAVVARLESASEDASARDLSADVLARLDAKEDHARAVARVSWRMRASLAAAAALLVAAGAWVALQSLSRESRPVGTVPVAVAPRDEQVTQALKWLAASQEADGSWDPAKWGGEPNYRTGVTALALMALTAGDGPASAEESAAAARARNYLLAGQGKSGCFGPFFSQMLYNHGIATVALLAEFRRSRDASLKEPIRRAVAFIRSEQQPGGGWGYVKASANTSITAWQVEALILASGADWPEAKPAADKGLAWVESMLDGSGRAGYSRAGDYPYGSGGLTAMAAMCLRMGGRDVCLVSGGLEDAAASGLSDSDYVQVYFLDQALRVAGTCPGEERLARAAAQLRHVVAERQVKAGPNSGSWEPCDRWGKAGGRVYATAMGALSLESGRRPPGRAD